MKYYLILKKKLRYRVRCVQQNAFKAKTIREKLRRYGLADQRTRRDGEAPADSAAGAKRNSHQAGSRQASCT